MTTYPAVSETVDVLLFGRDVPAEIAYVELHANCDDPSKSVQAWWDTLSSSITTLSLNDERLPSGAEDDSRLIRAAYVVLHRISFSEEAQLVVRKLCSSACGRMLAPEHQKTLELMWGQFIAGHSSAYETCLLLLPLLERILGDIFASRSSEPVPRILRDLIMCDEVRSALPAEFHALLRAFIGLPSYINVRNVVWHGFLSISSFPSSFVYVSAMLLIILDWLLTKGGFGGENLHIREPNTLRSLNWKTTDESDSAASSFAQLLGLQSVIHNQCILLDDDFLLIRRAQSWWLSGHRGIAITILLPLLEHVLRRAMVRLHRCDPGFFVAQANQYYLTLEDLLNFTILEETVVTALWAALGLPLMCALRDLYVHPAGPRLRDMFGHAECDYGACPDDVAVAALETFALACQSLSDGRPHLHWKVDSGGQFHAVTMTDKRLERVSEIYVQMAWETLNNSELRQLHTQLKAEFVDSTGKELFLSKCDVTLAKSEPGSEQVWAQEMFDAEQLEPSVLRKEFMQALQGSPWKWMQHLLVQTSGRLKLHASPLLIVTHSVDVHWHQSDKEWLSVAVHLDQAYQELADAHDFISQRVSALRIMLSDRTARTGHRKQLFLILELLPTICESIAVCVACMRTYRIVDAAGYEGAKKMLQHCQRIRGASVFSGLGSAIEHVCHLVCQLLSVAADDAVTKEKSDGNNSRDAKKAE